MYSLPNFSPDKQRGHFGFCRSHQNMVLKWARLVLLRCSWLQGIYSLFYLIITGIGCVKEDARTVTLQFVLFGFLKKEEKYVHSIAFLFQFFTRYVAVGCLCSCIVYTCVECVVVWVCHCELLWVK